MKETLHIYCSLHLSPMTLSVLAITSSVDVGNGRSENVEVGGSPVKGLSTHSHNYSDVNQWKVHIYSL